MLCNVCVAILLEWSGNRGHWTLLCGCLLTHVVACQGF